uniref:Uncharacterized protein n=1 Tax=Cucumis melo TaxID=3656 RepID=A0A9I9EC04_CUCME
GFSFLSSNLLFYPFLPRHQHHGNISFFTQLSRFPYRLFGQPLFASIFFLLLIHTTAAVLFFHRNQSLPASPNCNFFFTWIFVLGLAGNSRRSSTISDLFARNRPRLSSSLTDWKGSNNLCFNLNQSLNALCSSFDRDQSNIQIITKDKSPENLPQFRAGKVEHPISQLNFEEQSSFTVCSVRGKINDRRIGPFYYTCNAVCSLRNRVKATWSFCITRNKQEIQTVSFSMAFHRA